VALSAMVMTVSITLERAGTISIQGNVNVITDKDALVSVFLDGEEVGPGFYTSIAGAWANIPFFAMRNVPAGTHTITIRGNGLGSNARAGSRVVTVMGF
jgi:hypothetical protein